MHLVINGQDVTSGDGKLFVVTSPDGEQQTASSKADAISLAEAAPPVAEAVADVPEPVAEPKAKPDPAPKPKFKGKK